MPAHRRSGGYPKSVPEGYPDGRSQGWPRAWAAPLGTLVLAALAVGCVRHVRTPLATDHRAAQATQVRFAAFDGPMLPGPAPRVEALGQRTPRHRRLALTMTSVTDNNQPDRLVTATYYATTANKPKPLVIVLPIWGSSRYPPRKTVRWLTDKRAGHAANVLWIHGDERLIDWPAGQTVSDESELEAVVERWTRAIAGTVVDVRRLIDWAHTRPEVARSQVGVVGFSIGSIVGSLVAGNDDRIAASVLVAGGANLHQILATCRGNTQRFREAVASRLGWSTAQLEGWLAPRLEAINPTAYAAGIDPRTVLIIDAERDECIPRSAREDLWQALGRPERVSMGYGHRKSFLAMTVLGFHFTSHEIVDFLDRTLLAPTARRDGSGRAETVTVAAGPDLDP